MTIEMVSPVSYVENLPTPQLSKPRANRAAASAVFLKAVAVPFMVEKVLRKVEESGMSLIVASSMQNFFTVRGIPLFE